MTLVTHLSALLFATGCSGSNNGGFNTSDDDDSAVGDDDDTVFVETDRSAYVEFNRQTTFGEDKATTLLYSSWFNPRDFLARIPLPAKVDSCHSGENPAGVYSGEGFDDFVLGAPFTQDDIGSPTLTTPSGRIIDMTLGENYWFGVTESNDWESHAAYDISISGGADRDAAQYPGALGTPAALTLLTMDQDDEGLALSWYGGNDNGHVELRIIHTTDGPDNNHIWVVCRLFDDGEETVLWADLDSLAGLESEVELLRSATANFDTDMEVPGVATGVSSSKGWLTLPAASN